MGRPSRIHDQALSEDLRLTMRTRGISVAQVALAIDFSRATVHRALQSGSFSRSLRAAVYTFIDVPAGEKSPHELLQKSLHLLELSDRLRRDAERMISLVLDQSAKTQ